jgi:steroid delta-isomerase-like uncharacterized protein
MDSKTVARNFYESYNQKDIERSFEEFIAANLVNHTMGGGLDRKSWLEFDKAFLSACPDLALTVKEQIAEGNRIVTHWLAIGTHTGEFMDMPATGKTIRLMGVSIDAIEDGKIKEHLAMADFTAFMQQFS